MTGSYLTPLGQHGQAAAAVAADMEMGSLYSGAGGEAHLPDDFNAFDMNSVVGRWDREVWRRWCTTNPTIPRGMRTTTSNTMEDEEEERGGYMSILQCEQ